MVIAKEFSRPVFANPERSGGEARTPQGGTL
jgi:hypothetical protein